MSISSPRSRIRRHLDGQAGLWVPLAVLLGMAALIVLQAQSLPDFRAFEAGPERKAAFFGYVRPLVEAENRRVLSERERLEEIAGRSQIGWFERFRLESIADDYRIEHEGMSDAELLDVLLRRVDAVPMDLALAQAAKESGWGTSRFAREGNNLFGEWCFAPGCGLVPQHRAQGRRHEVEAFGSPEDSVVSYFRNLNTHDRYLDFRLERERLREEGEALSGLELADTLGQYSELRERYVRELKQLIEVNDLADEPIVAENGDTA